MTALLRCLAQRFAGPTARKLAKQARLSPGQARKTAVWHGNQFLANSMSLVVGLSLTGRSFAVQRNAVEHQEYPDTGNDTKPRNIILPVDNSEDSDYAVSWTLDNIYKAGDKMHFLHCIPRQPGSSAFKTGDPGSLPVAVDSMGSFHEAIRQRHRLTLDAVRKKFEAKLLKCNVPQEDLVYDILEESLPPQYMSTYFGVADFDIAEMPKEGAVDAFETPQMIGDVIVSVANDTDAAAVVMASHNKSPLTEFLLGSITNFCCHHCPKPVVILHNLPHPDEGLSSVTEPKPSTGTGRQLAVAVDDSQQSEKALSWTMDNIYRAGDVIHIIRVIPRSWNSFAFADGFGTSIDEVQADPLPHKDISNKLLKMLEESGIDHKLDLIIEHRADSVKSLGTAIVAKAADIDASMLIMASHGKGVLQEFLLGSVTSYVTHHCDDLPVVVLH